MGQILSALLPPLPGMPPPGGGKGGEGGPPGNGGPPVLPFLGVPPIGEEMLAFVQRIAGGGKG